MLPLMALFDSVDAACSGTSPFGTIAQIQIIIGTAIKKTKYPFSQPQLAVNIPEPLAMMVPPIDTKMDWNPMTLDLSIPVK